MRPFCLKIIRNRDQILQRRNVRILSGRIPWNQTWTSLEDSRRIKNKVNLFILIFRRKYELQHFSSSNAIILSTAYSNFAAQNNCYSGKSYEKQHTGIRHGLGHAFRNSWRRKESENKAAKKMVLFTYYLTVLYHWIITASNNWSFWRKASLTGTAFIGDSTFG